MKCPGRKVVGVTLSLEEYEALLRYREGVSELVSVSMAARIAIREALVAEGLLKGGRRR